MQKPTIADVARNAKVSKATVSRVLNDVASVDPSLRKRVTSAIKKLNYQPSRAARTLKKNLLDVIGFLVPSITDTIFGAVLQGAEDFAYQNKMGIIAYSTADSLERQKMYLENLQSEQLAGLILVPAPNTDLAFLLSIQSKGIPIVLFDRKIEGFQGDHIASDNFQGAFMAVEHLIDNGYKRIATIAGSQNVSSGIERLNGYREALTSKGLELDQELIKFGNFDEHESYKATKALLSQATKPDAVFVANDSMTIGALHALKDLGINIPNQLAVVGFDEQPLANLLHPTLTTIEQEATALGHEALRIFLDRIQNPDRPNRTVLMPTKLNIRESSRS